MRIRRYFCTEEHSRPGKYADGQAIPFQWLVKPSESIQYMYHWNLSDSELGKKLEIMRNWAWVKDNFLHKCNKEEERTWVLNFQFSIFLFQYGHLSLHTTLPFWGTFFSFVFYTLNFLFCIGVQPSNSIVVVSGEQRRDSAIHIHVSILPKSPSYPGCHIALSRVPCATH